MQLKFKVDTDRLTFGDLIELESAKTSAMVGIMARCLVNDAGEFMSEKKAIEIIRSVPLSELKAVIEKFGAAMEAFKDGAIPPTGGGK